MSVLVYSDDDARSANPSQDDKTSLRPKLWFLTPTCNSNRIRRQTRKPRWNRQTMRMLCMATILAAPITGKPAAAHQVKFDSDSQPVFVDNCATSSITNDINDCITAIQPVRRKIKGIAGLFKTEIYSTTIKWHFEDDNGAIHTFVLPRSFYIPSTSNRLFSPQH